MPSQVVTPKVRKEQLCSTAANGRNEQWARECCFVLLSWPVVALAVEISSNLDGLPSVRLVKF